MWISCVKRQGKRFGDGLKSAVCIEMRIIENRCRENNKKGESDYEKSSEYSAEHSSSS